jgi:hypothetical protein
MARVSIVRNQNRIDPTDARLLLASSDTPCHRHRAHRADRAVAQHRSGPARQAGGKGRARFVRAPGPPQSGCGRYADLRHAPGTSEAHLKPAAGAGRRTRRRGGHRSSRLAAADGPGPQARLGRAEALPDVPEIAAAADDEATARAETRRLRRYHRGPRRRRVPSVAVRETADGAHRPFPGTNPVRHASVDIATQRSTALQGDTPRDREETARQRENSQPAGRFRRWWQVLWQVLCLGSGHPGQGVSRHPGQVAARLPQP